MSMEEGKLNKLLRDYKPLLQPVRIRNALEIWNSDELPVAKLEWVNGPRKPRDVLRKKEVPLINVSMEALKEEGLADFLPPIRINGPEDVNSIPEDVDALVMGDMEDWLADDNILDSLVKLGKPIIYEWDSWGRALHGRLSKLRQDRFRKAKLYIPMNADEVKELIKALRGVKILRNLKVLYIGNFPPRSVAWPSDLTLKDLQKALGVETKLTDFEEYYETVDSITEADAEKVSLKWLQEYVFLDEREKNVRHYAKIYLGLKKMLRKYGVNALTVECPGLKDAEYVPCLAFSHLIDEGIPSGCEGDIPSLLAMALAMGVSGEPAIMGNLNENVMHRDLDRDTVVINHDVVTKSFRCLRCPYYIRDFHASQKGATPYTNLPAGLKVTLTGMHWNLNKIWATEGEVVWTEDTTHCRISIGVKVRNAIEVSRNAFGHHTVLVKSHVLKELEKASGILGLEFHVFRKP